MGEFRMPTLWENYVACGTKDVSQSRVSTRRFYVTIVIKKKGKPSLPRDPRLIYNYVPPSTFVICFLRWVPMPPNFRYDVIRPGHAAFLMVLFFEMWWQ